MYRSTTRLSWPHRPQYLALAFGLVAVCAVGREGARPGDAAPAGLHLVLNIPAYRMDLVDGDRIIRTYPVAVGTRRFATPAREFAVTRIVWNPWWHPPDRAWARKERITPPGPSNPMGRVKLLMAGPYYLHGSPLRSSIGSAASHGCIRMLDESAIDLARRLQRATGAVISEVEVDSLASVVRRTREVALPVPVPVSLRYELVELRGDSLLVHRDVYRRGTKGVHAAAVALLVEAGRDSLAIDRAALAALLRHADHGAAPPHAGARLDDLAPLWRSP